MHHRNRPPLLPPLALVSTGLSMPAAPASTRSGHGLSRMELRRIVADLIG